MSVVRPTPQPDPRVISDPIRPYRPPAEPADGQPHPFHLDWGQTFLIGLLGAAFGLGIGRALPIGDAARSAGLIGAAIGGALGVGISTHVQHDIWNARYPTAGTE